MKASGWNSAHGIRGLSHCQERLADAAMDFAIPADIAAYLAELDSFIEREIQPLEQTDDNIRFFDHRREDARTDWDRGGLPSRDWEALLREAVRRADAAGHYRYAFPAEYGGKDGTNLGMAVIREHLARKGLGRIAIGAQDVEGSPSIESAVSAGWRTAREALAWL